METPLHARINLLSFIPANYFNPPSLPERPIVKVIAYFDNKEYYFNRDNHGEDWQLINIMDRP
jgi:hypothetical protein